ncbi:MAG TPA: glucose 1-dehydrogenase [Acidimicrobiales bacterium]|jgi:3alpha(or 20beta)-hydroxysteroid dehydrogenase|nr:glucose 1-dehydrogenase [Acidimicrobiales bacterium]
MARGPRLEGKVALITGAARGMGAAEAARFVEEGARVVLADVLVDELAATAKEIDRAEPGSVLDIALDVTDPVQWQAAIDATLERFGDLHILVNNAGITGRALGSPVDEYPLEDWHAVLAVNLTGPFLGMRVAVPVIRATIERMRATTDPGATGSIVNISSAQGIRPSPGNSAYASSKWGLRGLTKVAALDAAPLIRVNSVHPGPVDTPMIRPSLESDLDILRQLLADVPLKRIGVADDIANLVLFLASDESSFSTGAEFLVEGGRLAGPPRADT